jgi:hypothetical protein
VEIPKQSIYVTDVSGSILRQAQQDKTGAGPLGDLSCVDHSGLLSFALDEAARRHKDGEGLQRGPAEFGPTIPDIFADEITGFDLINDTFRLDLSIYVRREPMPPSEN